MQCDGDTPAESLTSDNPEQAMTPENYPKCRTCRHYEPQRYGTTPANYGVCMLIGEHSAGARILADGYDTLTIDDPDMFGCSLHSELETKGNKS